MAVRSIPRYPEVREDGSLWVPLAPPPAPTYRPLSPNDSALVGRRAALSYSTEWVVDLRVLTDPSISPEGGWTVDLCDEGAWHDLQRHNVAPSPDSCVTASTCLVFLIQEYRRGEGGA